MPLTGHIGKEDSLLTPMSTVKTHIHDEDIIVDGTFQTVIHSNY